MRKKISGIYMIRNILNGLCYIGSSIDIKKRWSVHRDLCKRRLHHSRYLERAWHLHKAENFKLIILEEIEPIKEKLEFNEQNYIWLYDPEYNINKIAGRPPEMTEEHRKILSQKMSGANNKFFGKKRPEHSLKMSGTGNPWYGKMIPLESIKKGSETKCPLTAEEVKFVFELQEKGMKATHISKLIGKSRTAIYRIMKRETYYSREMWAKRDIEKPSEEGIGH